MPYDITCMQNLKYDINEFIYKTETDSQRKQTWLPKGKGEGGINLKFGVNRYTQLYIKQINNKEPRFSTGNYTQYLVVSYNEKESEKAYVYKLDTTQKLNNNIYTCICITESFTVNVKHCKSTILQFKKHTFKKVAGSLISCRAESVKLSQEQQCSFQVITVTICLSPWLSDPRLLGFVITFSIMSSILL